MLTQFSHVTNSSLLSQMLSRETKIVDLGEKGKGVGGEGDGGGGGAAIGQGNIGVE